MYEDAIWTLAAEGGMAALTLDRLSEKTGESTVTLSHLYPDPVFMVITLIDDVHAKAMNLPITSFSIHDQLTDRVMAHLDVSLDHRETIRRLWEDLITMPGTLLTLRPYLVKIVTNMLREAKVETEDFWGIFRVGAYLSLFLYVLYTWIYDDSAQQEQSLVILDKGLKQLLDLPW